MNATDVIGWGWGLGKDSFGNPSAQTRNKKDLAASNVSIFVGGGSPDRREAEFSKFKEREVEGEISCSPWRERVCAISRRWECCSTWWGASHPVPVLVAARRVAELGRRQHARARGVCKTETTLRSPF